MADFVTTQVKASKEVIDALINTATGHELEGKVDFNCILPSLEDYKQDFNGDKARAAWNTENWGTTGNAEDSLRKSDTSVYFSTASGNPQPVLRALSAMFPGTEILVRQAGETNYYWSGSYILLDGKVKKDPKGPNVKDIDSINRFASKVRNRKYA